jgi:MFS family permease
MEGRCDRQPRGNQKRGAIFAVLSFFFYCAGEASVGLWAATYFVSVRGVDPSVAASWGSLFFFGIMGGRMISGLLAMRVKERTLINIGLMIAVVGALLLALPLPQMFSLAGLLLFGLGCAPVFPNLIHITPQASALTIRSDHRATDGGAMSGQRSCRRWLDGGTEYRVLPGFPITCCPVSAAVLTIIVAIRRRFEKSRRKP